MCAKVNAGIKMIGITMLVSTLSVISNSAYGRQLSPREALENAVGKAQTNRLMSKNGKTAPYTTLAYTVETEGTPTVYVFTRNTGGYWIVAANDVVPNGLLGYTDTGVFETEDMPHNINWVLEQYGDQIAFAAAQETGKSNAESVGKSRNAVAPIIETHWGQTGSVPAPFLWIILPLPAHTTPILGGGAWEHYRTTTWKTSGSSTRCWAWAAAWTW